MVYLICHILKAFHISRAFSALVVASTSLFINPVLVVPSLILLEVVASLHMLLSVWKDTLWRWLFYMTVGLLMGIPLGVYILSIAPQNILRLAVSMIILVMTLLLIRGFTYKGELNFVVLGGVGIISGLFSGIAAAGGLVVATFLSAAQCSMKSVRATMVVFLLVTGVIFLTSATITGAFNSRIFHTFLLATLPMFVGIILGGKLYLYLNEGKLRFLILLFLSILSIIGIIRAFISMY